MLFRSIGYIKLKKIPYIYEESDLAHTYINNRILRGILEKIDLEIIKKSFVTVLTSEGFAKYHFGSIIPNNISLIPNRLNPTIVDLALKEKRTFDINSINFGFVGAVRFKAIYDFAEFIGKNYSQHTFHFFGACNRKEKPLFDKLKIYPNIIFHGAFSNPVDLPIIYSQIDLVVSTYDVQFENVRYAEPNKLYEAIYFNTPIIVSEGTFLSEKIYKIDAGFAVNTNKTESLEKFISSISEEKMKNIVGSISTIPKSTTININTEFFNYLKKKFKENEMFGYSSK